MLLYVFASFCIISATGYSVLNESYKVSQNGADVLKWPKNYMVKATRVSLTDKIVEDYTAWKKILATRIDYNHGAVKAISLRRKFSKYEIHPETTETELNKIVCHRTRISFMSKPDVILPDLYENESYKIVGNETIEETETVKFEYIDKTREEEIRHTIWALYLNHTGWYPVRYETKQFNALLGSLIKHEIWTYYNFELYFDDEVFDVKQFGCNKDTVEHNADSEKITKELLFVDPDDEHHVDHIFNQFQNKFDRKYSHEYEHVLRKTIFRENMRMISSVNRRNVTYKLGINQFSDWTPEEIERSHGALPRPKDMVGTVAFPYEESQLNDIVSNLPIKFDWRLLGVVSPVKNQESCGSCWTFAATAVTESGLARTNGGRLLSLSNQALVDCAYEYLAEKHAGGCHGGYDFAAYEFIMKHGLPTEQEYGTYKARDGFCLIGNMTKTYPIAGYTDVMSNSFNAMKVAVVNHGPLFVYIRATREVQAYSSGIFYQSNKECNPLKLNHAMALVGYGKSDGDLFWILKNSWGENWGIDGYMLVAAKDNVCGVASKPSYPVF